MEQTHLTEAELTAYRNRALPPAGILRVHRHITGCSSCAAMISAARLAHGRTEVLPLLLEEASPASHIEEDELIRFAAGQLTPADRVRVQAHTAHCAECRDAAGDLLRFRETLAEKQRSKFSPAWIIAAAAAVVIVLFTAPLLKRGAAPPPRGPEYRVSLHDAAGVVGITTVGDLGGLLASADTRALVRQTLESGTLPHGPGQLPGGGIEIQRGSTQRNAAFALISPTSDRVLSDRPEFEWSALKGASGYRVKIFDAAYNEVAHSAPVSSNRWQAEAPLARGQTYSWQVTAILGGEQVVAPTPPRPEARFQILDAATAAPIEEARSAANPSHLLLAALYARAGMPRQAAAELDALESLNAGSPLVASLRRSLK